MASDRIATKVENSLAILESTKARLATRRTFLKGAAATGAVAAMYAVPKLTSIHSRPAYANITGPCAVTYCVQWTDSSGVDHERSLDPINTASTAAGYYGYGINQGSSNDGFSANTPDQLEDDNSGVALFFLLRDGSGNVSLGTILDEPDDGSGGSADICYSGLPSDRTWSQKDDPTHILDNHTVGAGGADQARMTVGWNPCCTDGGMLSSASGGLNCACKITVEVKSTTGLSWNCIAYIDSVLGKMVFEVPDTFCFVAKPVADV